LIDDDPARERLRELSLTLVLVLETIFIFIAIPLGAGFPILAGILSWLVIIAMAFAIFVLDQNRIAKVAIVAAIVIARGVDLSSVHHPSLVVTLLAAGANLMAVLALSWLVAKAVFRPGRVTAHRVRGAIVLYLNFALGFAVLYELAFALSPGAFSGLPPRPDLGWTNEHFLYFSFTTLTTTGYGDITPIQPLARSLANLESVIGQLYPTTLLARIVTLSIQHETRD
jgi:voltage-gated potassium channel Kch